MALIILLVPLVAGAVVDVLPGIPFGHRVFLKPAPGVNCPSNPTGIYSAAPIVPSTPLYLEKQPGEEGVEQTQETAQNAVDTAKKASGFTSFGLIAPGAWMLGFLKPVPRICTVLTPFGPVPTPAFELRSYGTSYPVPGV